MASSKEWKTVPGSEKKPMPNAKVIGAIRMSELKSPGAPTPYFG